MDIEGRLLPRRAAHQVQHFQGDCIRISVGTRRRRLATQSGAAARSLDSTTRKQPAADLRATSRRRLEDSSVDRILTFEIRVLIDDVRDFSEVFMLPRTIGVLPCKRCLPTLFAPTFSLRPLKLMMFYVDELVNVGNSGE